MASARNILFVGSLGLDSAEQAFRSLAGSVGARARRYPDGEPPPRHRWILWVENILAAHPQLRRMGSGDGAGNQGTVVHFAPADGVSPADLHFDSLGYADAALASYVRFRALVADGTVPAGTRFQVSLPTPIALLTAFFDLDRRADVEAAIEGGLMRDIEAITDAIPAEELAIQWDVAHEVISHDGGGGRYVQHYDDIFGQTLERLCRLIGYIPAGVEAGIHLCYGDPGHKHVIEPESLATCVAFANAITDRTPRAVDWIHMPVPRDRDDDAYFAPLEDLKLNPETELFLGLVHHTDGVDGTRRRIATAERHLQDFGIATECGFGRRPPETIPDLFNIHATVADGA